MLSTIAQVVSIWFLVATAAALSLGALLRAVATTPAPLPMPKRGRRPEDTAARRDVLVGCDSYR